VIEINVPFEEIETRAERLKKVRNLEAVDRIPVTPAINFRYLIPKVNVSFHDYYSNPESMLYSQILGQKWLMENIATDQCTVTGHWVGGWPDFQNTWESSSLGCTAVFPPDDIPWVSGKGWVKTDKDLIQLEKIDMIHSGVNAMALEYRKKMIALAEKYPVRFQGGPVFYPGANPELTHGSDGPFTVAGDLMGHTELFIAAMERPNFVRELLRIVTEKIITYLDFVWELCRFPTRDFAFTDDLAAGLSRKVYQEVVLPFDQKLRFHFDGYISMHMCGKVTHLLDLFLEGLKINELSGFGYMLDLERLGEVMGGKIVLAGGVNPMLIRSGTPQEVILETKRIIDALGKYKGLILMDGNNVPPGSPVENINAMMQAAELYGRNP
jgi:uroporphyrinogen decarboxylase